MFTILENLSPWFYDWYNQPLLSHLHRPPQFSGQFQLSCHHPQCMWCIGDLTLKTCWTLWPCQLTPLNHYYQYGYGSKCRVGDYVCRVNTVCNVHLNPVHSVSLLQSPQSNLQQRVFALSSIRCIPWYSTHWSCLTSVNEQLTPIYETEIMR